jgi:hypothetical protein
MMDALSSLEKTLSTYFHDKAPKMPQDIQELIVQYGPWLMLVMLILSVPSIFGILGFGAMISPYSSLAFKTAGPIYLVIWALSIVILALDALALPGLFKREMRSWRFIFYSTLIAAVQDIISLNILGLIIGSAIGFYILFQIKHNYR